MRKLMKFLCTCMILSVLVWVGTVIADRQNLNNNLIRLHVVANSDSPEDQRVKLAVRDIIAGNLQALMGDICNVEDAKAFLQTHLADLEELANRALKEAGSADTARITLGKEAFPTREYDTFSLPAGVYESLRITIGEGEGKNWWCVVFPSLCIPAVGKDLEETAAGAGFPDSLTGALEGDKGYQVRFFALDCLGWIENFFFSR